MLLLFLLIFCIYLYYVGWLFIGLKKAYQIDPHIEDDQFLQLSIIIAAHNEERIIAETFDCLLKQDYPPEKFEIIVVADRCTDRTVDIVKESMKRFSSLKIVEIDENPQESSPKKYALMRGIDLARSNYLILMDADCLIGSNYLKTFSRYFQAGNQAIVNIPKVEGQNKLLHRYIKVERLMVWSIAAAGVGHGVPFLAFGTSWGYRRELLEKVGGFKGISHSLSGDDDLLIYRMGKIKAKISVCFNPKGWGRTRMPANLKEFVIQRRRHHSAGKYYSFGVKLGYLTFHLSNIFLWLLPVLFSSAIYLLLLKYFLDFWLLNYSGKLFQEKISLMNFVIFELGFILHHILIAPLGFVGKIRWR